MTAESELLNRVASALAGDRSGGWSGGWSGDGSGGRAGGTADALAALVALRELRTRLDAWEPELIAAARAGGASWAELAPVLGVASRQAAERRYLRMRAGDSAMTRDERVLAERDRRAGERAVIAWARANGADLRQLAGQITALTDLGPDAQRSLDSLHEALGGSDPAALIILLAGTQEHLEPEHSALAERVTALAERVDHIRAATHEKRVTDRVPEQR
jgi:hypothetical protein